MVFQRIISRLPGGTRISCQPQRLQSLKSFSQIRKKCDIFSGSSENCGGPTRVLHNAMPRFVGNSGMKFGFAQASSLKFASFIHSVGPKEFEKGMDDNGPIETQKSSGFFEDSSSRLENVRVNTRQPPVDTGRNAGFLDGFIRNTDRTRAPIEASRPPFGRDFGPAESGRNPTSMNFVRGVLNNNQSDNSQNYRSGVEHNADIVHIKLMRNNAFVTVTDSKGNKKLGASAGCLAEMKGGPKVSKYSAEATAEHVGRIAKSMGLKSVVIKVNGFTFFKKKKLAILSFRDGYTNSRSDQNPIVYIEDTTRKAHNGCRLRKQQRK